MMKIRVLSMSMLLAGLVSAGAFAVPADFVQASAELDRTYIPALGLSGQADAQAKAKLAFAVFEKNWDSFAARYASPAGFDAEWPEDVARISHSVSKAKIELFDKSNGPEAHEALEAVRMILLDARTRLKIPYFIDSLTLFHNAMEDLLNGKPAKPYAEWTAAEKLSFGADLDIAAARWRKVAAAESLLAGSGLPQKAEAAYRTQRLTIDSILSDAQKAFDAGEGKQLSEKLAQVKPAFIKTFFLFGDFSK